MGLVSKGRGVWLVVLVLESDLESARSRYRRKTKRGVSRAFSDLTSDDLKAPNFDQQERHARRLTGHSKQHPPSSVA